ncbi:MAG: RNA methyltransferase [Bifidobacterium sp.]|jgi:TrmH family RNA methyltransferase|nr:RNA methyltransferase [Bifidobacterium sp.]MCH4175296.1 RNA methyltransferase [Bifidobacterium sp.]
MPIHSGVIDNPKADRIRKVSDLSSRKRREEYGRFCIEGPQAVREAITYRPEIIGDLFVQVNESDGHIDVVSPVVESLQELSQESGIYVHHVTERVMHRISTDSQGILAVADSAALQVDVNDLAVSPKAMIAAFWQIRDPGNAGTVIRAADASGCDVVVFVDDCVDVLNPKVVRSSVGSLFHIPVVTLSSEEFFQWTSKFGASVNAADVYGLEGRPAIQLPELLEQEATTQDQPRAFLFGNEARGLPEHILKQVHRTVYIPMYGKAESLNLATSAAILLHTVAMSSHFERI